LTANGFSGTHGEEAMPYGSTVGVEGLTGVEGMAC
jgi:hypothetical protein